MYMMYVCVYDCVRFGGNVCCVATVVKKIVCYPWSVEVCCVV